MMVIDLQWIVKYMIAYSIEARYAITDWIHA